MNRCTLRTGLGPALAALVLLVGAPGARADGAAAEFESLDAVRAAALADLEARHAHDEGKVSVRIESVDPRLRLARCISRLETFLPGTGRDTGRVAVGVRCPGAPGWTLYVSAEVRVLRRVVVLARALPRGVTLRPRDVAMDMRDVARLRRGYATTPADVVGKLLRRPEAAGRVLAPADLALPRLVRRGQRVTMLARAGGVEIRTEGEALADGAAGDVIAVRNLRSRRVVDAVVAGVGAVDVRL